LDEIGIAIRGEFINLLTVDSQLESDRAPVGTDEIAIQTKVLKRDPEGKIWNAIALDRATIETKSI
jgi:hypothetical protein